MRCDSSGSERWLMRNGKHPGEEFNYALAKGEMNAYARIEVLPERPLQRAMTNDLLVVAAQLIEAACRASDGDHEYDLLIKCLRTGAVHGLRVVLVDEGPRIIPLLENFRRSRKRAGEPATATCYSLSRRQVGVLQMIARGMSNKSIARSLGIAPETVKTHAKSILNKLEARTRAQAVAHAEQIGLL